MPALPAVHPLTECAPATRRLLSHPSQIDNVANYKSFTEDWIALHSRDAKSPLQRPAILKEFGANVGGDSG